MNKIMREIRRKTRIQNKGTGKRLKKLEKKVDMLKEAILLSMTYSPEMVSKGIKDALRSEFS